MTPSAEQLEHLKIAQRASLRNAQTFNIYTALVVGGKRHDEALKDAEAAIEAWSEYEDAHAIEPPPNSSMNDMLLKMAQASQRLMEKSEQRDNSELFAIHPRDIIEASRDMARTSRNVLTTALQQLGCPPDVRMNLVVDCFNTGAAMMLKMLHGDARPEPWSDDYDHEGRLRMLLDRFGLLCENCADDPRAPASTDPPGQANGGLPQIPPAISTEKENV